MATFVSEDSGNDTDAEDDISPPHSDASYAASDSDVSEGDIEDATDIGGHPNATQSNSGDSDEEEDGPDSEGFALPVDLLQKQYLGSNWTRGPGQSILAPDGTPTCTQLRELYNSKLKVGMDKFLDHFMKENMGFGILNLSMHMKTRPIQSALDSIMVTMDPHIREAVMAGNLPERARTKHSYGPLRTALLVHRLRAEDPDAKQPIVYANFLVDNRTGFSPTYKEVEKIVQGFDEYVKDWRAAYRVDCAFHKDNSKRQRSQKGYRFYLAKKDENDLTPSTTRIDILRVFAKALDLRLQNEMTAENCDEPMPTPLSEWGFTISSKSRERDHTTQSSTSNWLMNLTEAIACEEFADQYRIKYYPIYCVPAYPLAALSEHFLTVVGQGYVANGGGFSHEPAGRSVAGMDKLSVKQAGEVMEWVRRHIPTQKNAEVLHKSMLQRIERIEQSIAKDEAEIRLIYEDADSHLAMRERILNEAVPTQAHYHKLSLLRGYLEKTKDIVGRMQKALDEQDREEAEEAEREKAEREKAEREKAEREKGEGEMDVPE